MRTPGRMSHAQALPGDLPEAFALPISHFWGVVMGELFPWGLPTCQIQCQLLIWVGVKFLITKLCLKLERATAVDIHFLFCMCMRVCVVVVVLGTETTPFALSYILHFYFYSLQQSFSESQLPRLGYNLESSCLGLQEWWDNRPFVYSCKSHLDSKN